MSLTCGDSQETLPAAAAEEGRARGYDVIRVDGGHRFDEAFADLLNGRKFARKQRGENEKGAGLRTMVVVDDCEDIEVSTAWKLVVELGFVVPLRPGLWWKGSCVGHYLFV